MNGNSGIDRLQRENLFRNRSERLMDRFLMRAENKQVEDLKQKLQHLQQRHQQALKRQKPDDSKKLKEEEQKKAQLEKEKQKREELQQKYANVDHYNALCKIIKHLYNPKKFSKCLQMIVRLVKEFFDFFDGNTLFHCFEAIMRYDKKFEKKEDRDLIEQLYLFLIELSDQDQDLFNEMQEKVLDLMYIGVYVQSNLYTDDNFKFNEVIREVNEMLESLALYDELQDVHEDLCVSQKVIQELFEDKKEEEEEIKQDQQDQQKKSELDFLSRQKFIYEQVLIEAGDDEEKLEAFLNGIKRRMFFQTLQQVYQFHKQAWARPVVVSTIKKVYLEKQKFNESEQEQLEDMISNLHSKISLGIKQSQGREKMDEKIKDNPLQASYQVKDGRAEKIVYGNADHAWASKQAGLNWSDTR
eukprot:403338061